MNLSVPTDEAHFTRRCATEPTAGEAIFLTDGFQRIDYRGEIYHAAFLCVDRYTNI